MEKLHDAEEILTEISNQKTFKWYYKNFICGYVKHLFPRRLSYNRFVEIVQSAVVPLLVTSYALS